MVFSEFLIRYPYRFLWKLKRFARKHADVVFYVESVHDYQIVHYVLPHMDFPFRVAAKTAALARQLRLQGVDAVVWPVFPDVVIMARHAFHRFPSEEIKKIGLRHGPYHFKKMIGPEKYNQFELYLFTSEHEADIARKTGIRSGQNGGYPRLDAFSDPFIRERSQILKQKAGYINERKTLLFTATWDRSGLSAIERWADKLQELGDVYNVVVSLHPMMSAKYNDRIRNEKGVVIASSDDLMAWMLAADILVSDTSSVLAEYCALDKPVITFKVSPGKRLTTEIARMIGEISLQIDHVGQIHDAVAQYASDPLLKHNERLKWNRLIFGDIQESHGLRAARLINRYLKDRF
jgi:CDP-glycerol glycerophosphotransferase (TagB/SpsB family)